ncbi:MAG: helix-turn-helix domain-containing protein [Chitinophagales bacterium]
MTIEEKYGSILKSFRIEQALSQEKLAVKTGLHRTYIGSVERGERNISLKNILLLCKALNVKPSVFFKELDDFKIGGNEIL